MSRTDSLQVINEDEIKILVTYNTTDEFREVNSSGVIMTVLNLA